jgi:hypothetical protein
MIKKTVETSRSTIEIDGKNIPISTMEDQYEDEAISSNLYDSISDFYNLLHLIKNSWTSKKYELRMRDAGYEIYAKKDERLEGWIGVPEKWDCLVFLLYYFGDMWHNAEKINKGLISIFDWDEDWWVYRELKISDIAKEKTEKKQRKVIKSWITETVEGILTKKE